MINFLLDKINSCKVGRLEKTKWKKKQSKCLDSCFILRKQRLEEQAQRQAIADAGVLLRLALRQLAAHQPLSLLESFLCMRMRENAFHYASVLRN